MNKCREQAEQNAPNNAFWRRLPLLMGILGMMLLAIGVLALLTAVWIKLRIAA